MLSQPVSSGGAKVNPTPAPKPAAAPAPSTAAPAGSAGAGGNAGAGTGPMTSQDSENLAASNNNLAASNQAATNNANNQQQESATATLQSMLAATGLDPAQVDQLVNIASPYISQNVPPQEVMLNIQNSAPFQAMFPGIKKAISNGIPPPSIADYLSYEQTAYDLGSAAGIPKSVMAAAVPDLIGNGISSSQLSERITKGYEVATTSDPQTIAYLKANFGVSNGDLAAFYLDPEATTTHLEQVTTAAQIAGAGENAGFAPISVSRAMQLAQLGVTQNAAVSGFSQIGQELPLTSRYGMQKAGNPGTVSQDTLVSSQFVGDQTSRRAVQLAQETRTAATRGGGGYSPENHGTAVGYGSESGFSS